MSEPQWASKSGNFWQRRSKLGKAVIIVVLVIVGISLIGAMVPSEDEAAKPRSLASEQTTEQATEQVESVTGRVNGRFHRDCFACGDLKKYIATSNAWCGWREDTLEVHVTMTNNSVEHVTVHWHPSYIIRGGTEHGAGFNSVQDDGFDAGETRHLVAEQHPEGVTPGAALSECKPSFSLVESG